jgi:hypothetical protein
MFGPACSIIRNQSEMEPEGIITKPIMEDHWNAYIHSRAIGIQSIRWPGHTMQAASRRYEMMTQSRSGIQQQANAYQHSRTIVMGSGLVIQCKLPCVGIRLWQSRSGI